MNDINEKETIQYFISGMQKARSAAKELGILNKKQGWSSIIGALDAILLNARKLYTGKPQTRLQTLATAARIEARNKLN